jgi:hypothetical protein
LSIHEELCFDELHNEIWKENSYFNFGQKIFAILAIELERRIFETNRKPQLPKEIEEDKDKDEEDEKEKEREKVKEIERLPQQTRKIIKLFGKLKHVYPHYLYTKLGSAIQREVTLKSFFK